MKQKKREPEKVQEILRILEKATAEAWVKALPDIMRVVVESFVGPELEEQEMSDFWLAHVAISPHDEVIVKFNEQVSLRIDEVNEGKIKNLHDECADLNYQKIIDIWNRIREGNVVTKLDKYSQTLDSFFATRKKDIIFTPKEAKKERKIDKTHFLFLKDGKNWLFPLPHFYPLLVSHPPIGLRQCLNCGQFFYPDKYSPDQKFCSTKCRVYYHRKRK